MYIYIYGSTDIVFYKYVRTDRIDRQTYTRSCDIVDLASRPSGNHGVHLYPTDSGTLPGMPMTHNEPSKRHRFWTG